MTASGGSRKSRVPCLERVNVSYGMITCPLGWQLLGNQESLESLVLKELNVFLRDDYLSFAMSTFRVTHCLFRTTCPPRVTAHLFGMIAFGMTTCPASTTSLFRVTVHQVGMITCPASTTSPFRVTVHQVGMTTCPVSTASPFRVTIHQVGMTTCPASTTCPFRVTIH